jgi:flagellar biosynthesis GTPase FlhF
MPESPIQPKEYRIEAPGIPYIQETPISTLHHQQIDWGDRVGLGEKAAFKAKLWGALGDTLATIAQKVYLAHKKREAELADLDRAEGKALEIKIGKSEAVSNVIAKNTIKTKEDRHRREAEAREALRAKLAKELKEKEEEAARAAKEEESLRKLQEADAERGPARGY